MFADLTTTRTKTLAPGFAPGRSSSQRSSSQCSSSVCWTALLLLAACFVAGPAIAGEGEAQAEAVAASSADQMKTPEEGKESATPTAETEATEAEATEAEATKSDAAQGAGTEGAQDEAAKDEYEWLTEEGTDRIYRVATLPKVEGTFRRFEGGKIRVPGGTIFRVVKESEDTFWVKVYKKPPRSARRAAQRDPELTEAERKKILAEYDIDLEEVDRIRLRRMDKGLPQAGQWRDGFDVADMNADGHLDIVFGPARKASNPRPNIFLGDGEGNWSRWSRASFEPAGYDYGDIAVADWNGDGHPDLVLGVHLRGLLALMNDGRGNFRLASDGIAFDMPGTEKPLAAFSSRTVGAADWNGDGRVDILALGEGPKRNTGAQEDAIQGSSGFRVYLNQEDGSWHGVQQTVASDTNFGADFAQVDIDGDATKDVVMGTMVVGNPWLVLHRTSEIGSTTQKLEPIRDNGIVDSLATADFDGDGVEDLVMAYRVPVLGKWHTGIDLLYNRKDGWERQAVLSLPVSHGFGGLDVGDLDGDGRVDIVAGDDEGVVWILLGEEGGKFVRDVTLEGPQPRIGCHVFDLQLHDFDHDGALELAAAYAGESQAMVSALVGNNLTGCEATGSLRVWDIEPVPAESAVVQPTSGH